LSKKQKLLDRLAAHPKDFTYDETRTLLGLCGFTEDNKGRTSGSRVMFVNKSLDDNFRLHKPHPHNVLKSLPSERISRFCKKFGGVT
jgi:hypothetical protein